MYRMNMSGSTPRDRLDPRLLERLVTGGSENGCGCGHSARTVDDGYKRAARREEQNGCSCGCGEVERNTCEYEETNSDFNYSLAMVYSPHQEWQNLYCVEEGMKAGTIFRELDKPFYGPKCHGGNHHE